MKSLKITVLIGLAACLTASLVVLAGWVELRTTDAALALDSPPMFVAENGEECPGTHLERHVCNIRVIFENNERVVESYSTSLNQECFCFWTLPGGPFCDGQDGCHSCPFGNWGVDSAYGSTQNSDQFRGWETVGSHREWNACTTVYTSSEFWTNGVTNEQEQDPWPNDARQWAGGWLEWELEEAGQGCAELDGNDMFLGNVWMDIYELDGGGDDFVTWLTYPSHVIPLTCPNDDTCDGTSPWYSPNGAGNSEISAKSRATITGSYFETQCIQQ